MLRKISCFATIILLFSTCPLIAMAQASTPAPSVPPVRARQEPCWRQAGIDRSVVEQRHTIELDAHSQIAAVCENSSLTPQQKQQQVREIRQQAKQKFDALITPDQQKMLQSCQEARGSNRPNAGNHPGGASPCVSSRSSQVRPSSPAGRASGSNPQPPENNSSPQN
jgi:hypothetical protein